jgi:hypothetical protein
MRAAVSSPRPRVLRARCRVGSVGGRELNVVAPGGLAGVKSVVCAADEVVHSAGMPGRSADRDGDRVAWVGTARSWFGGVGAESFGDDQGACGISVRKDGEELLAAPTPNWLKERLKLLETMLSNTASTPSGASSRTRRPNC